MNKNRKEEAANLAELFNIGKVGKIGVLVKTLALQLDNVKAHALFKAIHTGRLDLS